MNASEKPITHPDENLLAAFAERALRGAQRDAVASHLADCARCRDIVFFTQEGQPQDEVVVHPNPVRRRWQMIAAAASGLALLAAAFLTWQVRQSSAPGRQRELAESVPVKVPDATISAMKAPSSEIQQGSIPHQYAAGATSKTQAKHSPKGDALKSAPNSRLMAAVTAHRAPASPTRSVPKMSQAVSAGPQPAVPPALPLVAGAPAVEASDSRDASASLVSLPAMQTLTVRFAVVSGNLERSDGGGVRVLALPNGERAEAVASYSTVVLVLSRSRKLYRSSDLGQQWTPVPVQWDGTPAKLDVQLAGSPYEMQSVVTEQSVVSTSAASASVSSAASRTADNSLPPTSAKPSSLRSAPASNATFVLTNRDGKRWISSDGGQTWRPE
jgi:hypothetical protein